MVYLTGAESNGEKRYTRGYTCWRSCTITCFYSNSHNHRAARRLAMTSTAKQEEIRTKIEKRYKDEAS